MEVTCRRASHSIDPRAFNDGNIRFRNGHRAEKWLGDIQGKGGVRTNINGSITRRITLANTRLSFLKQKGITEQEISINAPELIDLQADRYNSNPIQFRYNITTVITVTSDKVELVRNLIKEQSELLKQGIAITGGDYRYNVQYDFTGLNAVKPQMIEEATKNARAAAIKFAKDSDSELGKIKRAYQGQFSIEDRDANTPYIKRIRVVTTIDYSLED